MPVIVARTDPFKEDETFSCNVPVGLCLGTLFEKAHPQTKLSVNGEVIAREDWNKVSLQENDFVLVWAEPGFGLDVALIIAIISTVIAIASMIYSFLQKPPLIPNPTGLSSDRYANLIGAGNPINKFQPIPKLYGKFKITPPLAANYYTRIDKRRQQLSILLCLGYGPMEISGYKVGKRLLRLSQTWNDVWEAPTTAPAAPKPFIGGTYTEAEKAELLAQRNTLYPALRQIWRKNRAASELYYDYSTGHLREDQTEITSGLQNDTVFFGNTDVRYYSGVAFEIGHPDQITLYAEDSEVDYVNHNFQGPIKTGPTVNLTDMVGAGRLLQNTGYFERNTEKDKVRGRNEYYWYTVNNLVAGAPDAGPSPATQGTASNTVKAILEIDFTALYCSTQTGAIVKAGVWFFVEYKKSGSSSFKPVQPDDDIRRVYDSFDEAADEEAENDNRKDNPLFFSEGNWRIIRALNSQLFVSLTIEFKTPGQYTIRLTRKYTYLEDGALFYTDCSWQELRSVQQTNDSTKPWLPKAKGTHGDEVVLMAMRLNHSGQLNGNVDAVSVLAESVLKAWNGTSWEEKTTSNPAWAYVDTLTGNATQKTVDLDEQIDKPKIKAWADWCDNVSGTGPGYVVNYRKYHLEDEPMLDRLRAIATAGYATWGYFDDKFSVAHEFHPEAFLPRQMLTPRNSWNFSYTREFPVQLHAYRVKFIDEISWEEAEAVVYNTLPDSSTLYTETNATRYEVLNTNGIVTREQASRYGRYMFNVRKYRQGSYTVDTDIETVHLVRGDCVYLAYDALKENVKSGRVAEVITDPIADNVQVKLDETVTLASDYQFYFRSQVNYSASSTSEPPLYRSTSDIGTYPAGQVLLFPRGTRVHAGDLFVLGRSEQEVALAKVAKVTKRSDQTVTLGLVDASSKEDLLPLATVNTTRAAQEKVLRVAHRLASPASPQSVTVSFKLAESVIKNQGEVLPPVAVSWTVANDKARKGSANISLQRSEIPIKHYNLEWWLSTAPDDVKTATATRMTYTLENLTYVPVATSAAGSLPIKDASLPFYRRGVTEPFALLTAKSLSVTSTMLLTTTVLDLVTVLRYPDLIVQVQSVAETGNKSTFTQAPAFNLMPPESLPVIRETTQNKWLDWEYIQNLMVGRLTVDGLLFTHDIYIAPVKYLLPTTDSLHNAESKKVQLTRTLGRDELPTDSKKAAFYIVCMVEIGNYNTKQAANYQVQLFQEKKSTALASLDIKDVKRGTKEKGEIRHILVVEENNTSINFYVRVTRMNNFSESSKVKNWFTVAYLSGIRRIDSIK